MKTSESIKELATALAKAQAKLEGAEKDATNTFHKSNYANLEAVVAAAKIIHEFDLSFVQGGEFGPDHVLTTRLMHTSGEWIEGTYPIRSKDDADPQKVKSAHTYARRASLMAILGMSETDDDGNAASNKESKAPAKPSNSPVAQQTNKMPEYAKAKVGTLPETKLDPNQVGKYDNVPIGFKLSEKQVNRLHALAGKAAIPTATIVATVKSRYGCLPSEMTKAQYETICLELEQSKPPTGGSGGVSK